MAGRTRGNPTRTDDAAASFGEAAMQPAAPALSTRELAELRARVRALVEQVVAAEGLDLEDVAISRMGRRYLVRVTVDADGGIGHDELSDVSQAVSTALDDAEQRSGELTPGSYTLELSSPGVDRPLTQPRHWHRNVGRLVLVKVGGRQVTGRVAGTDEYGVQLDVDGRALDATFDQLGPGRVQVEFARLRELAEEDFGEPVELGTDHRGPGRAGGDRQPTDDTGRSES
ncbi:MAG TPA: ribosome maturation factor RimP [Micromonosporaceae bacterium]